MSLNSQIADLILEKGRAQAQGAAASGQAWGSALSQIGQQVGQTIGSIPRNQEIAAQTAEAQRARASRDEFAKLLKDTPLIEQDGAKIIDLPSILTGMNSANYGPEGAAAAQHVNALNDGLLQAAQGRLKAVTAAATGLRASGDSDKDLALHVIDLFEANHTYPEPLTKRLRSDVEADPTTAIPKLTAMVLGPPKLREVGPDASLVSESDPTKAVFTGPSKPIAVPEGGSVVRPGTTAGTTTVVATGAPKPMNKDKALTDFANPNSTPEVKATAKAWLDAEALTRANPDEPITIKTMENGKPVEKVMTRKAALEAGVFPSQPPAAIQVNNAIGNQTLPSWALDSSRPTKEEGNKFNPQVGMTPNGLYQAAQAYLQTGQFPPTARGSNPRADAIRSAVTSKVGALAADAGVDVPTFRALYKANSSSLGQMQKSADAAQAFLSTADKNSELLEKTLSKIPDVGSPLLNAPLRSLDQKALGSVDMSQFKTYLQSVQNEYAKILTQPNLAGQLTDSARKEAEQLVSGDSTVAQMIGSLQALRAEGGNRLASLGEQIGRIQSRMQAPASSQAAPASATTAPTAASAPMTRTIRNTKTGETKTQTSTDGGVTWK